MDYNPNAFYKKIWFWLMVIGMLFIIIGTLTYLYTTSLFSQDTLFVIIGFGSAFVLLGGLISIFSARELEPTLKTFTGEDTKITKNDLINMDLYELKETFTKVTGVRI